MRVFWLSEGKDPGRLPSKSGALKLHIRRAHYQTTIWLNVTVPAPEHIVAVARPIVTKAVAVKTYT